LTQTQQQLFVIIYGLSIFIHFITRRYVKCSRILYLHAHKHQVSTASVLQSRLVKRNTGYEPNLQNNFAIWTATYKVTFPCFS